MKRAAVFFILSVFSLFSAVSQSANSDLDSISQVMVPRDVFIGDSGQIQYSFRSPVDLFAIALESKKDADVLELNLTADDFVTDPESCTVTRAVLTRNGVNYNLCITIIPWKVGGIEFKTFDLASFCSAAGESSGKNTGVQAAFPITLSSVTIASLSEKLQVFSMKEPLSPVSLPGTNYAVWGAGVLILLILIGICFVLARLSSIIEFVSNLKERFGMYRNLCFAKKSLKSLLRKKIDDCEFAKRCQNIFRTYLEKRFCSSFASVPAARIVSRISSLTGNSLSGKESETLEKLSALFLRTDYIRYAAGSIDSMLLPAEEHKAEFIDGEKKSLIEMSLNILDGLECGTTEGK